MLATLFFSSFLTHSVFFFFLSFSAVLCSSYSSLSKYTHHAMWQEFHNPLIAPNSDSAPNVGQPLFVYHTAVESNVKRKEEKLYICVSVCVCVDKYIKETKTKCF